MYRNTNSNHTRVYRNNLQILVEKLTSRERLLVDLKYKQNLTIPEVAMQMGLTESNVKVINNRLIKKLRTEWEKMKY
jgi:RNA polymerase sigma factor (sigma-70 family)